MWPLFSSSPPSQFRIISGRALWRMNPRPAQSVRTINTAVITYSSTYQNVGFPPTLSALGGTYAVHRNLHKLLLTGRGPERGNQGWLRLRVHRRWFDAVRHLLDRRHASIVGGLWPAAVLLGPDQRDSLRTQRSRLHFCKRSNSINDSSHRHNQTKRRSGTGQAPRALLLSEPQSREQGSFAVSAALARLEAMRDLLACAFAMLATAFRHEPRGAKSIAARLEARYRGAHTLEATFLERYSENGQVSSLRGGHRPISAGPEKCAGSMNLPKKISFWWMAKRLGFMFLRITPSTRAPAKQSADWRTPLALLAGQMKLSRVCARVEPTTAEKPATPGNTVLYCPLRGEGGAPQHLASAVVGYPGWRSRTIGLP